MSYGRHPYYIFEDGNGDFHFMGVKDYAPIPKAAIAQLISSLIARGQDALDEIMELGVSLRPEDLPPGLRAIVLNDWTAPIVPWSDMPTATDALIPEETVLRLAKELSYQDGWQPSDWDYTGEHHEQLISPAEQKAYYDKVATSLYQSMLAGTMRHIAGLKTTIAGLQQECSRLRGELRALLPEKPSLEDLHRILGEGNGETDTP